MKITILFALSMIINTPSFAGESEATIIDSTDTMALVQIDGSVARVFYNLIKSGKTSVVSGGPARVSVRSEVVGENVSCSKVGTEYSCRIIATENGSFSPETSMDRN